LGGTDYPINFLKTYIVPKLNLDSLVINVDSVNFNYKYQSRENNLKFKFTESPSGYKRFISYKNITSTREDNPTD